MDYLSILWDDVNDLDGNVEHIAEHGLDIEDVEDVLSEPSRESDSHSSGLPVVWGYTPDGRYIFVVYEQMQPFTGRRVPPPRNVAAMEPAITE